MGAHPILSSKYPILIVHSLHIKEKIISHHQPACFIGRLYRRAHNGLLLKREV